MDKKFRSNWKQMVKRCTDPRDKSYYRYGGVGISVCDRWLSFDLFCLDMLESYLENSERVLLDRKDNSLGYCKGNCRWVTVSESNYNKRPSVAPTNFPRGVRPGGKRTNKFKSCINFKGKRIHLGMFETVTEAHEAYKTKALELYGYLVP